MTNDNNELENYITELSPAEQEQFAGLITDARARQARLEATSAYNRYLLEGLAITEQQLRDSLGEVAERVTKLAETMASLAGGTPPPDEDDRECDSYCVALDSDERLFELWSAPADRQQQELEKLLNLE